MKKISIYNMLYIFIFASIMGWIIEGLWTLIKKGVLINHSAVAIGPFNFIYGICAVIFTILLYKYKDSSIIKLFLICFLVGTIYEYVSSFCIEHVLGFAPWDYSQKFLNINGRVSLLYSFCWGILGVLWFKFLEPKTMQLIEKINVNVGKKILIFLVIFLIFDVAFTFSALNRARNLEKGIVAQNSYERFLDKTFNKKYLKNMYNNRW